MNNETENELIKEIRGIINASENRTAERFKEMNERFKEMDASVRSIKDEMNALEERMTKKLNPLKEEMSLMEDKVKFYGYQATGGGMPKEVRRVPGGYGLLEPRSSWRRERYGR